MSYAADLLYWLVLGGLAVVVSYGVVRAGSFAYYRTRLEYERRQKEKRNGV